MPTTIVWDADPKLLEIGPFVLRWYNLLFAAAFIFTTSIGRKMFAKSGKGHIEIERLQVYLILFVILGARLGHAVFYEWSYYQHHLLQIFLPVVFSPKFSIVGFSGLASHGAGVGILLAIFLYVKRIKITFYPPRIHFKNRLLAGEFLSILDHLAILIPLAGTFIRIGNFMNSEIIGKPTGANYGVVFVRNLYDELCQTHGSIVEKLVIGKAASNNPAPIKDHYQPIQLAISFKNTIRDEMFIKDFLQGRLKNDLVRMSHHSEPMVYESYGRPLSYTLKEQNGNYQAMVYTLGIPRHPAQLYESFSCFLIFIILFLWWHAKNQQLATGRILGTGMVVVFSLRFFYEFYKENQVTFENTMWLNMGQLLSLPWIVAGLFLILRPISLRENENEKTIL